MTSNNSNWNKEEFKTYLLLLCAHADSEESKEEITFIKSKTNIEIFDPIYKEFKNDSQDQGLDKIEENIHAHQYSHHELTGIKKEMHEVFFSDKKMMLKEEVLSKILDNILY